MKSKKPPAKKPAKTNHDDRAPFGFYIPSEVTTSSRTQPPAKPVKAPRVKRPKYPVTVDDGRAFVSWHCPTWYMSAKSCRTLANGLLRAASYLEQENRTS